MPRKGEKHHGERDSPFFRLKARAKLAKLLHASRIKLESLAGDGGLYHQFPKPKTSGGVRLISAPRPDLKGVQARIAVLLQRLAPPNYLFAPVPGRSYVDNAAAHLGAKASSVARYRRLLSKLHRQQGHLVLSPSDADLTGRCCDPQGPRHPRGFASAGQPLQSDPCVPLLRRHVGRDFAHGRGCGLHSERLCRRPDHIWAAGSGGGGLGNQESPSQARSSLPGRQGAEQVRAVCCGDYGGHPQTGRALCAQPLTQASAR